MSSLLPFSFSLRSQSLPALSLPVVTPTPPTTSLAHTHTHSFLSHRSRHDTPCDTHGAPRRLVRQLFYRAYDAYLARAFPSDELLPLSCRGTAPNATEHGTPQAVATGRWARTLVDTLDTLAVLGDWAEFDHAVALTARTLDERLHPAPKNNNSNTGNSTEQEEEEQPLTVSLFETTIRVLGGLLSAHAIAARRAEGAHTGTVPYRGALLQHAETIAQRLLPAFFTPTGVPCATVRADGAWHCLFGDTTPADAGTLVLEWATLARLTARPAYRALVDQALAAVRAARSPLGLYAERVTWDTLNTTFVAAVAAADYTMSGRRDHTHTPLMNSGDWQQWDRESIRS